MADTGLKLETARFQRLADGRFLGQGFDLVVDLARGPLRRTRAPAARGSPPAFEAAYREKFALTPPDVPVEFINIRVAVRAPVAGSEVVLQGAPGAGAERALKGRRPAYFREAGGFVETTVYDRARLGVGDRYRGPGGGRGGRLDARRRAPARRVAWRRAATLVTSTARRERGGTS